MDGCGQTKGNELPKREQMTTSDLVPAMTSFGGVPVSPIRDKIQYMKALLYGKPGVGKTTLIAQAQRIPGMSPVLFMTPDQAEADTLRKVAPEAPVAFITRFEEFDKIYKAAAKLAASGQPLPFKTFIIDTGTEAQKLCVDTETEILTKRGWLRYDQVRIGDETLAVNPETGFSEWSTVSAVNIYPGLHETLRIENNEFSAVTTPHHRWLVRYHARGPLKWRRTDNLGIEDRFIKAVPHKSFPVTPKYTDAFVKLVAWYWTGGGVGISKKTDRNGIPYVAYCRIFQVKPEGISQIRQMLDELTPENSALSHYTEASTHSKVTLGGRNYETDGVYFALHKELQQELAAAPHLRTRVIDPAFILDLTEAQLHLFVETSLLGDGNQGTAYNRGNRSISQNGPGKDERIFPVHLAMCLLGIPTGSGIIPSSGERKIRLLKRPEVRLGRQRNWTSTVTDTVWCPTTSLGTWLARRNGRTYYTGNSMNDIMSDLVLTGRPGGGEVDFDVPSQREWGQSISQVRTLVRHFRDLPVNFLMACHEAEAKDNRGINWIVPDLPGKLKNQTCGMFSNVFYLGVERKTRPEGRTKIVEEERRLLLTGLTEGYQAKSRTGLFERVLYDPKLEDLYRAIISVQTENAGMGDGLLPSAP